ncbi:MAG: hypothetical protein KDD22_07655, partial [Bdellovibrionales bacterium]|nr:hypothetical protein [Bdellovibrionales bacterium]
MSGKNFSMTAIVAFLMATPFLSSGAFAAEVFKDFKKLQDKLGFRPYYSTSYESHPLKVAVLDQGFFGYEEVLGKSLPSNTEYHAGPVAAPESSEKVEHGKIMAQIFYQLLSDEGRNVLYVPTEFHLYNVAGFSNFKAAIDDLIEKKVDLVLYSEVWQ